MFENLAEKEQKRQSALITLEKVLRAFEKSDPNSDNEQKLAVWLIDIVVFHEVEARLEKNDWEGHEKNIKRAAEIVADGLLKEAVIYDEEERKTGENQALSPEKVFNRLKLILEAGVLDLRRLPHIFSFMRDQARKKIKNGLASVRGNKSELQVIRREAEECRSLGILDLERDSDVFKNIGAA